MRRRRSRGSGRGPGGESAAQPRPEGQGYRTLTSTDELVELCDRARATGRLALDTEFLWERTYAPQICLVQVNVDGDVAVGDPLEGIDVAPIGDVLADPDVQVVMHAPHADLVAFAARYDITPANIFDTQLAAGFAGYSAGLSYERLVHEVANIRVQPSESFTDWSKRPLNPRQLVYAAEDVEFLFDVADRIITKLDKLGRADWAFEELDRRFADRGRLVTDPLEAWRRVSRRGKLRREELGVLRHVAAWREELARHRDLPTSWVMKDPTLVEIARRAPKNPQQLSKIRGVDGGMRGGEAERLISAVRRGVDAGPVEDEAPQPPRLVRKRVAIAKGLATALLRAHCEEAEIAPELVGTSQDVEDLIGWVAATPAEREGVPEPFLLRGWRSQFGQELVNLVEGRVQLRLSPKEPYLVIEPTGS